MPCAKQRSASTRSSPSWGVGVWPPCTSPTISPSTARWRSRCWRRPCCSWGRAWSSASNGRRALPALSHPHIIPIYAVKESEHVLYFVMKYVQGRALDTVIRDVGTLPIPMVQTILAQVGDALGYAHRHGVIHRDIKSANIMLDEDGRAVVTDFGIAKVVQAEGLTMTGVTVGTPTYMSP